jgi:hypothetical protein
MMSVSPGLYPVKEWRPTSSEAEKKVYDALKSDLPKGWVAWHSLKVRTDKGYEGEGDFIIAVPHRGLLVLEVKGGNIEVNDGQWFQNSRRMSLPPREQGYRFKNLLIKKLAEKHGYPPAHGVATCFPDTPFDNSPSQADLDNTLIAMQHLKWMKEALIDVFERAVPTPLKDNGAWIEILHSMWGEFWRPSIKLGTRSKLDGDERLKLDEQQIDLLCLVDKNKKVLIEGAAGSGKTTLAFEKAAKLSKGGKRVLFLSFTEGLAKCIEARVENNTFEVNTVRRFASSLLIESGKIKSVENTNQYWDNVCIRAADEVLPIIKQTWDAIIIDEGQDFSDDEWLFVDELSKTCEYFWVFYDQRQAFWRDRALPHFLKEAFQCTLPTSYRCPEPIVNLADAYLGNPINLDLIKTAQKNGIISLVSCPNASAIRNKIENEINKLLGEGLSPSDIAILILRGKAAILDFRTIGCHKTVLCDDPTMTSNIVADGFLRFKGLERPAIIIFGLELVNSALGKRMYIALTRALTAVRIVADQETLKKDSILRQLL